MLQKILLTVIVSVSIIGAQGFIIIDPPHPRPMPQPGTFILDLREQQVEVSIRSGVAVVKSRQIFVNPTTRQLHGTYLFPVPADAAITDFSMTVNGEKMSPELLPASEARRIFDEIVRQQRDPALLEYCHDDMMQLSIFPLQPGERREIVYRYNKVLSSDNRMTELRLPLASINSTSQRAENVFKIDLESSANLKNIYSPTHQIEVRQTGDSRAVITGSHDVNHPAKELQLFYMEGDDGPDISLLTHRAGGEEGFVFFNIVPPSENHRSAYLPKRISFVLDVSGSMSGEKIAQAQAALKFCVEQLHTEDQFNVIRFSTQADALFSESQIASASNKAAAQDFIRQFRAIGGTNIEEALTLALQEPAVDRPSYVVFITDGKPTIGQTDEQKLISIINRLRPAATRIFTFGIGDDINTHLLDRLTLDSGGYRSYIRPHEDIEIRISSFYNKIASPVLTDLKLAVDGKIAVSEMYPQKLPDLFAGEPLTVLARYRGHGQADIRLTGQQNDRKKTLKRNYRFEKSSEKNDFIARLWASRAIAFLLEQVRLNGETAELKKEIVGLACEYGIITPYTSYLIREDLALQTRRRPVPLLPEPPVIGFHDQEGDQLYRQMEEKSGAGSVSSSEILQDMATADKYAAAKRRRSEAGNGNAGISNADIDRLRYLDGYTFYYQDGQWIDARILSLPVETPRKTIVFGDSDYQALLSASKRNARILALGQRVSFYVDGIIYQVVKG